jgi:hypothetical protein
MSDEKTLIGPIEYLALSLILSNNLDNDNPLLRGARGWAISLRRLGY